MNSKTIYKTACANLELALAKFARADVEGDKALHLSEQFLVLITCGDEKQKLEMVGRF
jgi:hypothetical protein